MASTKPRLLVCLLSLLILSHISISKADEQLINQECHNADVPTTCLQCLKSNPTSLNADRVGIAKIVIKCLNTHLDIVRKNVSSLSSTVKDRSVKSALGECGKGFSQTKKYLSDADNGLTAGDYDVAGHSVRVALINPVSCESNLQSLKLKITPDVYYQLRVYEELSIAAMRIIDRF